MTRKINRCSFDCERIPFQSFIRITALLKLPDDSTRSLSKCIFHLSSSSPMTSTVIQVPCALLSLFLGSFSPTVSHNNKKTRKEGCRRRFRRRAEGSCDLNRRPAANLDTTSAITMHLLAWAPAGFLKADLKPLTVWLFNTGCFMILHIRLFLKTQTCKDWKISPEARLA